MNHRELVSKNYVCVYAFTYVYRTCMSLLCVHNIYVCICLVNACVFICMYSYYARMCEREIRKWSLSSVEEIEDSAITSSMCLMGSITYL